jgi:hypothetical protein
MQRLLPALILLILILHASPAQAQQPAFVDAQMTYTFGESIEFSARLLPPQPVSEAQIFISASDHPGVFTDEAHYDPATGELSYTYTVQPGALHPFSEVTYWFEVSLDDRSTVSSRTYAASYADDRFDWQTREEPGVTLHWYQGGPDFAQQAADAARAGLIRIHDILPVSPSAPLDIYIYANSSDLQSALGLTDAQWAAGEASPELGAALVSIAPSSEQRSEMERQIPHELAHLLHYELARADWAEQPAWLREGIATNAELNPDPEYARALAAAAADGTLLPLAELCAAFPPEAGNAFLAYAEAESFVHYLRENYGATGLEALTRAYADGLGCEQGAGRAFGVALTQLEQDWLAQGLGAATDQGDTHAEETPTAGSILPFVILLALILIVPLAMAFNRRR